MRRGVVVVGGAPVWREGNEFRVPSGHRRYLEELADAFEHVTYFAAIAPSLPTGMQLPRACKPGAVTIEPLRYMDAGPLPKRIALTATDALRVSRAVGQAQRVVHYFPAVGGPLGLAAIRRHARAHVVYLKSDWIAWTKRRAGKGVQRAYWSATERIEARLADAMVFRSATHLERLRPHSPAVLELAQPLLAARANDDEPGRPPRAEGEPLRVLFVGGLLEAKGLGELMEAAAAIRSEPGVAPFRLLLAGGKDAFAAHESDEIIPGWLRARMAALGVEDLVEAFGHIDDSERLSALYRSADIMVLPSWTEGFPRVIDEAMSFGLPVVTTTVGGIPDALTHERDALLVPPKQPQALAAALTRLLTSNTCRQTFARAARRSYDERIKETAAAQHTRLLEQAWSTNRARR